MTPGILWPCPGCVRLVVQCKGDGILSVLIHKGAEGAGRGLERSRDCAMPELERREFFTVQVVVEETKSAYESARSPAQNPTEEEQNEIKS